jgi:hypothetical protein
VHGVKLLGSGRQEAYGSVRAREPRCPGCNGEIPVLRFPAHISGCTRVKGNTASHAHAILKDGVASIARTAGVGVDRGEPTDMEIVICIDVSTTSNMLSPVVNGVSQRQATMENSRKREAVKENPYGARSVACGFNFVPVVVSVRCPKRRLPCVSEANRRGAEPLLAA